MTDWADRAAERIDREVPYADAGTGEASNVGDPLDRQQIAAIIREEWEGG